MKYFNFSRQLLNFIEPKIGRDNELKRNLWLQNTLEKIPAGSNILDAGAGESKNKKFCKHLKYTSQDFNEYRGDGDGTGFQMGAWNTTSIDIVSDICEIPVESETFDYVLCSEVLEHVPNPVLALVELDRVLKKGGILILTAPFGSMTHFSPFHFCSGFNQNFYRVNLKNFDIIEIQANGNFFDTCAEKVRLIPRIAKSNSSFLLGLIATFFSIPLLYMLIALKRFDKGSSEISTYGYFVVAKKN